MATAAWTVLLLGTALRLAARTDGRTGAFLLCQSRELPEGAGPQGVPMSPAGLLG